ncbi:unnamed protein product [Enterobius vermicularis]|uniref:SH2 domain-containing protein n=1 Tax=Enterobius vermicularis TaxID=51028 RepID=A0A0N4V9L5_ENTVE|nr:unnamed protein product [Enterobius vermicularis]
MMMNKFQLSTVEVSPKQNDCTPYRSSVAGDIKLLITSPPEIKETPKRPLRKERTSQALHFDERLSEWIYPVDDILLKQLEQVAYFFKNTHRFVSVCIRIVNAIKLFTYLTVSNVFKAVVLQSYFLFNFREFILKCLLSQPEGAFILRFSESKRRCLALSVRVPFTHNPTGVSHYLIIRNENGFKIKGFNKYFPSIPMLITHHTVMPEQLPCRLLFADWDRMAVKDGCYNNYDYPPCDDDSSSNNSAHS